MKVFVLLLSLFVNKAHANMSFGYYNRAEITEFDIARITANVIVSERVSDLIIDTYKEILEETYSAQCDGVVKTLGAKVTFECNQTAKMSGYGYIPFLVDLKIDKNGELIKIKGTLLNYKVSGVVKLNATSSSHKIKLVSPSKCLIAKGETKMEVSKKDYNDVRLSSFSSNEKCEDQ
jgi:hypothetical protein